MDIGKWKLENGSWKWKLENGNRKREMAWHLSATESIPSVLVVYNLIIFTRHLYSNITSEMQALTI